MHPVLRLAAVSLLSCLLSAQALAWGKNGHRITGQIASHYLSPQAKAAIARILGTESLPEASNWPDRMYSHPGEYWQTTAKYFHYVTVPEGKTYSEVGAPDHGHDAYTALAAFKKTLQDKNATKEQKQIALRYTVHIIGDLHQPLHAGNGTDRGGNQFRLEYFWEKSNIHRVWDSGMIDSQQLSYTEYSQWLNARITPEKIQQWSDINPLTWIAESTAIRDTIYPVAKAGEEKISIGYRYNFDHLATLERRLSMAGIRMATYLNALFGE